VGWQLLIAAMITTGKRNHSIRLFTFILPPVLQNHSPYQHPPTKMLQL
jgi:hypothetical protein